MIYGRYRWFSKRTAYRSDFCLNCQSPQIAERFRTVDFLHVYFVPIFPLGRWQHWHCSQCSEDPHKRRHTGRWVKVVGAAVFGLLTVIYLILATVGNHPDSWGMVVLFSIVFLVFLVLAVRHQSGISLNEGLENIPVLDEETCLYCGGELWGMPLECEDCHLYRL